MKLRLACALFLLPTLASSCALLTSSTEESSNCDTADDCECGEACEQDSEGVRTCRRTRGFEECFGECCGPAMFCSNQFVKCQPGCKTDENCGVDDLCAVDTDLGYGSCVAPCVVEQGSEECFGQCCEPNTFCDAAYERCSSGCRSGANCLAAQYCGEEFCREYVCPPEQAGFEECFGTCCAPGTHCQPLLLACQDGCITDDNCRSGEQCIGYPYGTCVTSAPCTEERNGFTTCNWTCCPPGSYCEHPDRLDACGTGCQSSRNCESGMSCIDLYCQ